MGIKSWPPGTRVSKMKFLSTWKHTLQGTNIFPTKALLKMIFLFPRWDVRFLEGTFSCSQFDLMLLVVFCRSRRALHCRGIRARKLRKKVSQREFVLFVLLLPIIVIVTRKEETFPETNSKFAPENGWLEYYMC